MGIVYKCMLIWLVYVFIFYEFFEEVYGKKVMKKWKLYNGYLCIDLY